MDFWEATYSGVTKSFADWRMSGLSRKRHSASVDMVTFLVDGANLESVAPFNQWEPISFKRDGTQWFYGWVTKCPRRGNGSSEGLAFEVSGPWYWLEKTVFQQQWKTLNAGGSGASTVTTTRSNVILGQALDGFKLNTGQVMREVLYYCQYAFQGLPFPDTVELTHLPPAPDQSAGPFQIGTLLPSIVIPYTELRDKSCGDIMRLLLKYTPDAVAWFDYSTSPPTFNISQRGSLPERSISVLDGGDDSGGVTEFHATPRNDLQVPCVIAKFESHESRDGASYDVVTVQQYPPGVLPNTPRAWVQTIDLVGSSSTQQTADVKCTARPTAIGDSIMGAWFLKKESWLTMQNTGGSAVWDSTHIAFDYLTTVIDSADPLNTSNPTGVPLPDCHTLVNELLTGAIEDWMTSDLNLVAAKVAITVWARYTGSDAATAELFRFDPNDPLNPTASGAGYLIRTYNTKVTNASTGTYSQLTSLAAGEPVPTGFAQYLYETLAKLQFDGELTIVEQECSDRLPVGCIFNTIDGLAAWRNMDAMVLSVTEQVDTGTTSIQFGPPLMLGLRELEELFRTNLGRLPSYKLNQRTTGKTTAGANVQGPKHLADTNTVAPPPPLSLKPGPFGAGVTVRNTGTPTSPVWVARVKKGILSNSQAQGDIVSITGLDSDISIDASGGDFLYLECSVTALVAGTATIQSGSSGLSYDPSLLAWDPSGKAYIADDGGTPPVQNFFRVKLADILPQVGTAAPVVVPSCINDLQNFIVAIYGRICLNPYPVNSSS